MMAIPSPLKIAPVGDRALRIERVFHAPRNLVWRAFHDPDLVPKWLWARDAPMSTCDMDFREGGGFVWGWTMASGTEMLVRGRFVEITPISKVVHTELFDQDWTGGETTVTTEFFDVPEGTRMSMSIIYSSTDARDAAVRTPMADGMEEGYARLDSLISEWV